MKPSSKRKTIVHPDRRAVAGARTIVVKLGTGILSDPEGGIDFARIRHLASQVHKLRGQGRQVILVSSGAISAGMSRLGLHKRPTQVTDLQACAAIGQNLLMANYDRAFRQRKTMVAQILLTHEDFRHPERCQNARLTITNLLKRGVIPVINENDAVSFAEIKFGDNDQLAAMVHVLVSADVCVILSNVDGFYLKGNTKNEAPELLSTIPRITPEIERHAGGSNSHRSVGGMRSKLLAARRVLSSKKPLVIANGHIPDVLPRLCRGDELGTIFMP